MERRRLANLRPQAYEHPNDRSALDALSKTAGFDRLVSKLNEWSLDRLLRVQLTGSYLQATSDSFPQLHAALRECCQILDIPTMPALYLAPGTLNAFTAGVSDPIILLNTATIELLEPDELVFVIGHEIGHIKSGHVLYYQMAEVVPALLEMLGAIAGAFGTGLEIALLHWKRMSEFTADRAGLLACQDAGVALRTMTKLAGLPATFYNRFNTEDFIEQARAFESMNSDKLTLVAKALSTMGATHPWTVMRAQQLLVWAERGEFERVLDGAIKPPLPQAQKFCTKCGNTLNDARAFCPNCGAPIERSKAANS